MQGIVTDVEKQYNVQFLPGTNEKIGFMAHSWEPLRCKCWTSNFVMCFYTCPMQN